MNSVSLIGNIIKNGWQLMCCAYAIKRLPGRPITILGGRHIAQESPYFKQAYDIASFLVQRGCTVLTGGGEGIMHAATCGAFDTGKTINATQAYTLGFGIEGLDGETFKPCIPIYKLNTFAIRKIALLHFSCAYIIFPGGVGTADELFYLLNLMSLGKMERRPIILIGTEFWHPLVSWYQDKAIASGYVDNKCHDLVTVVDDIDQIMSLLFQLHI